MFWHGLIIGLFIGSCFGMVGLAICISWSKQDENE